jgi:hypothetical protein
MTFVYLGVSEKSEGLGPGFNPSENSKGVSDEILRSFPHFIGEFRNAEAPTF